MDLDFNNVFKSGQKSKSKIYKKFIYWFCKHYFYCDIHPNENISGDVQFAHNALGVVINKNAILEGNIIIQHHVTIGSNNSGIPRIRGGCFFRCPFDCYW